MCGGSERGPHHCAGNQGRHLQSTRHGTHQSFIPIWWRCCCFTPCSSGALTILLAAGGRFNRFWQLQKMNVVLKQADAVKQIADNYKQYHDILFIGPWRKLYGGFGRCAQSQGKFLTSTARVFGGEMKHGPLALVGKNILLSAILSRDQLMKK